jgi:hypothetical protein
MIMASGKRASLDSGSSHPNPHPRNEHPFTRSVSGGLNRERGGSADPLRHRSSSRLSLQSRRGSVSSLSSIGGTLDTSAYSHGVSESAHNGRNSMIQAYVWSSG